MFVETLDKCFENVCELDLIFHVDRVRNCFDSHRIYLLISLKLFDRVNQVHHILNELVMGGMVLETNMSEIMARIEDQSKLEKQEVCIMIC